MTVASLESPSSRRAGLRQRLASGRARAMVFVAAAGLCLLVVVVLLMARSDPERAPQARPAGLTDLPARPEEIEARGGEAASVLAPDDARARNAAACARRAQASISLRSSKTSGGASW